MGCGWSIVGNRQSRGSVQWLPSDRSHGFCPPTILKVRLACNPVQSDSLKQPEPSRALSLLVSFPGSW